MSSTGMRLYVPGVEGEPSECLLNPRVHIKDTPPPLY